jgi:DNA-binding protein H-NS
LLEKEMRKPRDLDGELKALHDKARELKTRKVEQLGELVIAGADSLSADELAGELIVLAATKDTAMKEAWAKRGAALFQSRARRTAPATERDTGGARGQPAARNRQQAEGAARCAHVAGRASQTRAASYRTRWPRRQSRYRGPDRRRPRYDLQRAAVGAGKLKSHHGGRSRRDLF